MKKLYLYNNNTNTLHINGMCRNATGVDMIGFSSENDAVKSNGRALKMCIVCMGKREEILREYLTKNNA